MLTIFSYPLAICMSSLEKCLCKSLFVFNRVIWLLLLSCRSSLYILEINLFMREVVCRYFLNPSIAAFSLFPLLCRGSLVRRSPAWLILFLLPVLSVSDPKKLLPRSMSRSFSLVFSNRSLTVWESYN